MTNQLNPEALEAAAKALDPQIGRLAERFPDSLSLEADMERLRTEARAAVSAYLAALPAPRAATTVEQFINERPEYITALQNTRGTDDQADYHRWHGGAEARRQLAQALGWTVPHNPGETTKPEGGGDAT